MSFGVLYNIDIGPREHTVVLDILKHIKSHHFQETRYSKESIEFWIDEFLRCYSVRNNSSQSLGFCRRAFDKLDSMGLIREGYWNENY